MKPISMFRIVLFISLLSTLFSAPAHAEGVVECNNCPSTRNAAISNGAGLTLVIDFGNAKLTAYDVEYDKELRRWRALPVAIPPQISAAFYRILDAIETSAAHSQPHTEAEPQDEKWRRSNEDGGLIIPIHPDNAQNSNPWGSNFPNSYRDSNAHEMVQSATFRSRLGQHLALDLAGANTKSAAWNALALSAQKISLKIGEKFGMGALTIMITWRDGSKTYYRITQNNVSEAKYVGGMSRDSKGNKIPDEAITNPQVAPSYVGNYYFGEVPGDGPQNLERWIQSARMYGVPVTGSSPGNNGINCGWDGRNLTCQVH